MLLQHSEISCSVGLACSQGALTPFSSSCCTGPKSRSLQDRQDRCAAVPAFTRQLASGLELAREAVLHRWKLKKKRNPEEIQLFSTSDGLGLGSLISKKRIHC